MELKYPLTHYVYRRFSIPIAKVLVHTSVTPNMVTYIATFLGFAAAYLIALRYTIHGIIILMVSQILDCADGDLARLTNRVTKKGAYLDRVLDRFVDAGLIIALISLKPERYWFIGTLAIVGTFLVSVTRIMAEAIDIECKVGLATRDFRILAIVIGLLMGEVFYLLVFLAILGFLTAFHRMIHTIGKVGEL